MYSDASHADGGCSHGVEAAPYSWNGVFGESAGGCRAGGSLYVSSLGGWVSFPEVVGLCVFATATEASVRRFNGEPITKRRRFWFYIWTWNTRGGRHARRRLSDPSHDNAMQRCKPATTPPPVIANPPSRLPLRLALGDVQAQAVGVEVDLVAAVLEDAGDVAGVFKLAQVNVAAALFDGVTDELGGARFTLGAHDGGLFLLPGLVDDKGGALGFLLGDLLGLDGGGEFGREGEVLWG